MTLRINKCGRYRLLTETVTLASLDVKVLPAGTEFTVSEVAVDDSVVFIPEFGGWTYCEISAEFIGDVQEPGATLITVPSAALKPVPDDPRQLARSAIGKTISDICDVTDQEGGTEGFLMSFADGSALRIVAISQNGDGVLCVDSVG